MNVQKQPADNWIFLDLFFAIIARTLILIIKMSVPARVQNMLQFWGNRLKFVEKYFRTETNRG